MYEITRRRGTEHGLEIISPCKCDSEQGESENDAKFWLYLRLMRDAKNKITRCAAYNKIVALVEQEG